MVYLILAAVVLLAIMLRALHRAPPMPEEMAVADEDWNLIFQERIIYSRPASERFKDLGGEA